MRRLMRSILKILPMRGSVDGLDRKSLLDFREQAKKAAVELFPLRLFLFPFPDGDINPIAGLFANL